ncbi:hypothetical protein A2524_02780 [Candidatus Wolfebacteria bacterium RIFOXYD12_FULL_48_21]|nr:MAG: hypothetical protein A2524_02780 [Candidatus Wolfebacteria bacterium RIFOXYD12_FULL_48_21]
MITAARIKSLKRIISKKLHVDIIEISFLGKGACSNIFSCKTRTGQLYCLKEERSDKFDTESNDIVKEARLIQFLNTQSIALIPEVTFILNKPRLYCYKYIQGKPLNTRWNSLSEKNKVSIMKSIGKYHAELYNKISIDEAGLAGVRKDESDFIHSISNILPKLKSIDKSNSQLYKKALWMQKSYRRVTDEHPVYGFLHGDLHQGNLLVNHGKLAGIVDFGKSAIGDIHKDFSHHARHYPEYIDVLIDSYKSHTGLKLSKDKIIFYAFLKDLEKLTYHIDKYATHKKNIEAKTSLYDTLLS